ncbi:MAG: hypothetical protein LBH78_04450 [Rickettsiales bacterium]|jgi:hypothetical protein|nr:hypothetical protein [Rickettsiales bacterium]
MTVQTQDQSIWKLKNTAHITKAGLQAFFAIAAVTIAATTIYAAAKGIALSSVFPAFLANPWVIATIAFVAAAYLIATAISSYQQIEGAKGQDGQSGQNGKDADFSALLGDAVKGAKIVEKEVTEDNNKVKKLYLELSGDNHKALLGENKKGDLHVIFKNAEGEYTSTSFKFKVENEGKDVVVDNDFAKIKEELGADEKATSLKVAVSNQSYEDLQTTALSKLVGVAVEKVAPEHNKAA